MSMEFDEWWSSDDRKKSFGFGMTDDYEACFDAGRRIEREILKSDHEAELTLCRIRAASYIEGLEKKLAVAFGFLKKASEVKVYIDAKVLASQALKEIDKI